MKIVFSKKLLLAASMVVLLNFSSCKKYDDGHSFTLVPAKNRLVGEWKVVRFDNVPLATGEAVILEFEKDNDFSILTTDAGYSYSYSGGWEWDDKKDAVKIDLDNTTDEFKMEIDKLTKDELWFTDQDNQKWECEKK